MNFPLSLIHIIFGSKASPCPVEAKELTYPLLKYFCSDAQGADGATAHGKHH